MASDLSQLSDSDLMALKSGDLTRVSDAGLMTLKGSAQPMQEPAFERDARELQSVTGPELIAGAAPTRFALGAASPILGAAQIAARNPIGQMLGQNKWIDERIARIEAMKQRGMKAYGQPGLDIAGMAGAVASPLAALRGVPVAATLPGRMAQGVGMGAVAGGTTPVEDTSDFSSTKAAQTATGAAIGGAFPLVTGALAKGGRTLYNAFIEPWVAPAAIKGRAFLEAAGDKADEIMALLKQDRQLVPGSAPTAGEAAVPAGRAEFAALQRSASKVSPSAALARADEQNTARLGAVRTVGKDLPTLAAAEKTRNIHAAENYGAARQINVKSDSALEGLLERPSMDKALSRAAELSKEADQPFMVGRAAPAQEIPSTILGPSGKPASVTSIPQRFDEYPVSSLHHVKTALDDMIKDPERFGIGATEARAIAQTQKQFVKWLEQKVPAYEKARVTYAAESKPINQMQVGQYLEQKLTPALSEEAPQRAASFAGALRDAPGTIKRATGAPRFDTLSEALTPEQLRVVNAVRDDLARSARFETMAGKGAGAGPNAVDLATASMERELGGRLPNILHRGAMIANSIVYRLEGKINKKLASEIAAEMLNPPGVAESMRQAQLRAAKNENMSKAIQNYVVRPATVGVAQAQARE